MRSQREERQVVHYYRESLQHEFFSRLESRMGEVGRAVPTDSQENRELAARLLGNDDPCASRLVDARALGEGEPPVSAQQACVRLLAAIPCRRLDKPGLRHTMPSNST